MEQILRKLSEIETTADEILKDADRKKRALSEETERQCKEFDAVLEKETDAKIRDIRNELEKEKDSRLAALKEDTEQHLVHLDYFYKENHQRISEELFKKIITA